MPLPNGIHRISDTVWEIPPVASSRGCASRRGSTPPERLLREMDDGVFDQVTNVATLPGIVDYAFCMPDGHWGYGFPIGGVAAMDPRTGVISPGGIGFDINCGMRLVRTNLTEERGAAAAARARRPALRARSRRGRLHGLPAASRRREFRGAGRAGRALGRPATATAGRRTSSSPRRAAASPAPTPRRSATRPSSAATTRSARSAPATTTWRSRSRGRRTSSTPGWPAPSASTLPNQVVVMFHCGSRGFGHQVATDYLKSFLKVMGPKYGISRPRPRAGLRPLRLARGAGLLRGHEVRDQHVLRQPPGDPPPHPRGLLRGLPQGPAGPGDAPGLRRLATTRPSSSATSSTARAASCSCTARGRRAPSARACAELPGDLPGDRAAGDHRRQHGDRLLPARGHGGGAQTFFTTAHGSGRTMSRHQAKSRSPAGSSSTTWRSAGSTSARVSYAGLAEEAGAAYKDIDHVVDATELAGISRRVVRLVPIGNVKG